MRKRDRYERQRLKEEAANRGRRSQKKELDLGTLLIAPICPRFHVIVENAILLQCWKSCVALANQPFKWKKMKEEVQQWLAERKASHYHRHAARRVSIAGSGQILIQNTSVT
jgi:hypothetical protein